MLKFQNWYAGIWIAILLLYSFGWSALNMQLDPGLLTFFCVSILISILLAAFSKPIPLIKMRWRRERKPVITISIILGFFLDWAYQRQIPVFHSYSGFDPAAEEQAVIGIPVVHVVLTAVAIFYAMYLAYLYLSDTKAKGYLCEYCAILAILLLNNSRGYVVYTVFVGVLLYVAFNKKKIFDTKVKVYCLAIFGALGIIFFISAAGNIRVGYAWNDCSYIERIGCYRDYPEWLSKHFMWFYTYSTSPLANLNLNCQLFNGDYNLGVLLTSLIPEQIGSLFHISGGKPAYIVQHLNACTGFVSFVVAAGLAGLFVGFLGLFGIYTLVKYFLNRYVVLQTFGNAVLSFLVIAFIFFNSLSTSALCYIPLFLVIGSIYLSKRHFSGDVEIVTCTTNCSTNAFYGKRYKRLLERTDGE